MTTIRINISAIATWVRIVIGPGPTSVHMRRRRLPVRLAGQGLSVQARSSTSPIPSSPSTIPMPRDGVKHSFSMPSTCSWTSQFCTMMAHQPCWPPSTNKRSRIGGSFIFYIIFPNDEARIHIIEDVIPLFNIKLTVRVPHTVESVRCVPQNLDVDFIIEEGEVICTIPKLEGHQMIELAW